MFFTVGLLERLRVAGTLRVFMRDRTRIEVICQKTKIVDIARDIYNLKCGNRQARSLDEPTTVGTDDIVRAIAGNWWMQMVDFRSEWKFKGRSMLNSERLSTYDDVGVDG